MRELIDHPQIIITKKVSNENMKKAKRPPKMKQLHTLILRLTLVWR